MIRKSLIGLFILLISVGFNSCQKAGEGGRAILNVHVFNGSINSPYAKLKISYGSTGFPGAGAGYDKEVQCDHRGQIALEQLRRGNYYLYAFNYDSTSTINPFPIFEGGTHFEITNRNGERSVVIDLDQDPE